MNDTKERRVATLTAAAKKKSQLKMKAADTAIRALVKRGEAITFHAVQREAGVSHAFLYKHPELRQRIEQLHSQHGTTNRRADKKNSLVLTLTQQIVELKTRHREQLHALRDALERAHGETSSSDAKSPDAATPHTSPHQSQQRPDKHKAGHRDPNPR